MRKDTLYKRKKKRDLINKPLPFESAVAAVNSFDSVVAYLLASYYYLEPAVAVDYWAYLAFDYWLQPVELELVVISFVAVAVVITLVAVGYLAVVEVVVVVGYCSIVAVELVDHWHHPDYYQCYSDVVGCRKRKGE